MEKCQVESLRKFANEIRKKTIHCIGTLGVGHFGGSMSVCEALAVLYQSIMKICLLYTSNYMANNYKLARVSGQPGKTRMLNVYRFNDAFQLVDLPGYGYAAVSKGEVKSWAGMVEDVYKRQAIF